MNKRDDLRNRLGVGLVPRILRAIAGAIKHRTFDRSAYSGTEMDLADPALSNDGFEVACAEPASSHDNDLVLGTIDQFRERLDGPVYSVAGTIRRSCPHSGSVLPQPGCRITRSDPLHQTRRPWPTRCPPRRSQPAHVVSWSWLPNARPWLSIVIARELRPQARCSCRHAGRVPTDCHEDDRDRDLKNIDSHGRNT